MDADIQYVAFEPPFGPDTDAVELSVAFQNFFIQNSDANISNIFAVEIDLSGDIDVIAIIIDARDEQTASVLKTTLNNASFTYTNRTYIMTVIKLNPNSQQGAVCIASACFFRSTFTD